MLDECRPIRGACVPVPAAPLPVDARLRAIASGSSSVVVPGVSGRVAGFRGPVPSLSRAISAVGAVDDRPEAGVAPLGDKLTLVRTTVPLVGNTVALISEPVPLVRGAVPLVRGAVPLVARLAAHLPIAPFR